MSAEHAPVTATPDSDELSIVFVDQSKDARDFARDAADKQLTEHLNEGGRVKRFIKGIWKGNLARDYYRQSYIQKAQTEIENQQDVLSHTSTSAERRADAIATTINRFASDNEALIHETAGEKRTEVEESSDAALALKDIVSRYAGGTLTDEALGEEGKRAMKAYRDANGEGEGLVQISNLLEIAKAVKGKVEHGESLDNIITNMKVIAGEARTGARSEAKYDRVDKVIDKIEKSKLRFIPKGAIVAGVTIASSLARIGSTKAINAAAMTVIPGLGAGVIAGLRERKRVKDERIQHAREMASGGQEIRTGSKRRAQMEKTRYETKRAVDLSASLDDAHSAIYLDDSERASGETKDGALQAALDALAAVQARNDMSDAQNIDLISYTDVASIGDERMALDLARAKVKVSLEQELDDATRARLGLEPGTPINELIASRADAFADIDRDMSDKDKAFRKLRRRRALKVGGATGATAIVGGLIAQEAIASLSDTREGLVEQLWNADNVPVDGVDHQTILHSLAHGDGGSTTVDHHIPSSDYTANSLADHSSLSVSNETNFTNNGDGTFNLTDPTGAVTAENVPINPDGSMPQSSIDLLRSHGLSVEDKSYTIDLVGSETRTGGLPEYMEQYKGNTTHVTRDLWYDNDTEVYDKNELDLWRGGTDNNGINPDGGYQYSIASMTEGGSYNGDQAAHWKELAANGQLKVAVSASAETQTQVFMIDISPDGTINIPPDSPASAFFTERDGQAVFTGKYMEVTQLTGVDTEGVEHIRPLSTLVGSDEATNMVTTQEIPTHTPEPHYEYKITGAGYDTTTETAGFTEMAPVTPVASRRAMETLKETPATPPPYYPYEGGRLSPEALRQLEREMSPRLRNDPDARLNLGEETTWYREQVRENRGTEYVEMIDRAIESSPELSQLSPNLKSVVTIPVKASGESESQNIYSVLSDIYGAQDSQALDESLVLLHVNWTESAYSDPAQRAVIEHTRAEIERARRDNPRLKIATIESAWTEEQKRGGLIGHVARRLNDAALLAIQKGIAEGRIPSENDVLIIRNDADPKGMGKQYLHNYLNAFESNDESDVFTGTTRFDNMKANDLPGFVFAGNFMQSLNLLSARREGAVHTAGANFGIRASTFAAVCCSGFDDSESGAGSDDVAMGRRIVAARNREAAYIPNSTPASGYFRSIVQKRRRNQTGTYSPGSSRVRTARKVGYRVVGAQIDTDSDRLESLYLQGIPIINTWNPEHGFDQGGHKERNEDLASPELIARKQALMNESPDETIERVRSDIEGTIRVMGDSETLVRSGLAFMFSGLKNGSSTDAYNLVRKNGTWSFTLTPTGADYLKNHLARDSKGRFDPYGNRLSRQLYGKVKPGSKRRPVSPNLLSTT